MFYAIQARNLVKTYVNRRGFIRRRTERVQALRGVSFNVRSGEVYGLLGPNGAGKTTTIKIISTLLIPDSGEARVLGYDVIHEAQKVREVIGVSLSVERGFFWKLTGYENLKYFGMLRGLSGRYLDERINYVLEIVGLKRLGGDKKFFEEFSLGMKARLAIARALLHDPRVVILDEPTLGLDPQSARTIRDLLVKLAREEGKTVLITSHNMFEVELICDRIAIINKGVIIAEDTVDGLKKIVSREIPVVVEAWKKGLTSDSLARLIEEKLKIKPTVTVDDKGFIRIKSLVAIGEEDRFIHNVIGVLQNIGARVRSAKTMEPSLEDVFIKLTGGETLG
ncbi:MAG: ABC transporter [Desulfurococcales archaeon ex4484_58]|nr:MAG: ABC transporter [Desulfurococcales archaeon ex4484_58]